MPRSSSSSSRREPGRTDPGSVPLNGVGSEGVLPQTRRQLLLRGSALSVAALLGSSVLSACGTSDKGSSRSKMLVINGFQWGPPTNFNPLNSSPAWPCGGQQGNLLFETLLNFNQISGEMEPGLAKELKQVDDATIELPLQPKATWHDGKPFTAADVVFTYEIAKRDKTLPYSNVWDYLESVEAKDKNTVVFKLNAKLLNPRIIHNSLATERMLPKHIWSKFEGGKKKLVEQTNLKPIGTGPYKLDKYDQTQIQLVRHEKYWGKTLYGKLPDPEFVVHPIFKDNNAGNLKFEKGEADISQNFTPQIWELWGKKDPGWKVSTWMRQRPYHVPGGTPMLVVNTTKKGLTDPKVRRALAHAMNFPQLATSAMSSYSETVTSSLVIPGGAEDKFFDKANAEENGWKYDPEEAIRILEKDLKAKKGSDGIYKLPDGTRLGPFTVLTPTGWSDYQTACRIVAESAKKIGIEVKTEFPEAPVVTANVQSGDFDLAVWGVAPLGPATPWQRMRDVLGSRGVPAPGKPAFWNYGRFKSAEADKLLDKAAAELDDAKVKPLYAQLDKIFMQNAPMIPLMYRPVQFFSWNESHWTGFPDEKHDYAPPQFYGAGSKWLFKIKKKDAK
jgi:peptide/nickel transport system substrate-binding protein